MAHIDPNIWMGETYFKLYLIKPIVNSELWGIIRVSIINYFDRSLIVVASDRDILARFNLCVIRVISPGVKGCG